MKRLGWAITVMGVSLNGTGITDPTSVRLNYAAMFWVGALLAFASICRKLGGPTIYSWAEMGWHAGYQHAIRDALAVTQQASSVDAIGTYLAGRGIERTIPRPMKRGYRPAYRTQFEPSVVPAGGDAVAAWFEGNHAVSLERGGMWDPDADERAEPVERTDG